MEKRRKIPMQSGAHLPSKNWQTGKLQQTGGITQTASFFLFQSVVQDEKAASGGRRIATPLQSRGEEKVPGAGVSADDVSFCRQ